MYVAINEARQNRAATEVDRLLACDIGLAPVFQAWS